MARVVFLVALVLQAVIIYAKPTEDIPTDELENQTIDNDFQTHKTAQINWTDIFALPRDAAGKLTKKPTEAELEEIKEMAKLISQAIHDEMTHLLAYAMRHDDDETEEIRQKRSTDSSTDNSLIIKLLKHIKSNNEFQNVAIEKIMSAQQAADDAGLDFTPNSDIFTELAIASSKQIEELSSILNDAYNTDNIPDMTTEIEFVPVNDEPIANSENDTYYRYHTDIPQEDIVDILSTPAPYEYVPEILTTDSIPEISIPVHDQSIEIPIEPQTIRCHFHIPFDTQIPPPPFLPLVHPTPPPAPIHEHTPFSYSPEFFEHLLFSSDQFPHEFSHHVDSPSVFSDFDDIVIIIEETEDSEPELVGEELEETISSKVLVNKGDEPGSATVNHVMTYTVSEKSHFKRPPLEIPELLRYYFFMI